MANHHCSHRASVSRRLIGNKCLGSNQISDTVADQKNGIGGDLFCVTRTVGCYQRQDEDCAYRRERVIV